MSLGPQCLQCKKRRVKCGSEEPGCDKCSKDGFNCPGYSKGFTFVHVRPRTKAAASRQKSRAAPGPVTPVSIVSLDPKHPRSHVTPKQQLAEKQISKRDLIPSLSSIIPSSDQQLLMFVEHAQYFVTEMSPDMSATHWRTENAVTVRHWLQAPLLLQDMIVTSALETMVLRHDTDPTKMYKYRGRVLRDLSRYFDQPAQQTLPMSIALVVSVIEQEIHVSPVGGFKPHLNAAQELVRMSGGIKTCIEVWPETVPTDLLVSFMETDIVSTTTTSATQLLAANVDRQSDHLKACDDVAAKLLDSPFPCPIALLDIIVRINKVRANRVLPGDQHETMLSGFLSLLSEVQEFNPWSWARTLTCLPSAPLSSPIWMSAVGEWANLAHCYQSATLLYLIRSNIDTLPFRLARHDNIHLETLLNTITTEAHHQLSHDLQSLFRSYPLRKATPEKPTLWRFTIWPLMMFTYETTFRGKTNAREYLILDRQSPDSSHKEDTLFTQLRSIGTNLGSSSILAGATMFEQRSRSQTTLEWDDFFATACVFYF